MTHGRGGEDALHDIFRAAFARTKDLPVGPGEDCAVIRPGGGPAVVLSCDQVVAGVHLPRDAAPAVLARKLVGRTLSDLAAAGARPWALLWTATVPARRGSAWIRRLARAVLREASRYGAAVIGGDLSTGPEVVLGCTALGRPGRRLPPGRGGARPGQLLCVTGRLGGAVRSGRHLRPTPRLEEGRRLVHRHHARALMDLSDGLARDLPRLLRASGVGATLRLEDLPLAPGLRPDPPGWESAVGEGEDYELLAALTPADARRAAADPVLRRCRFTVVGETTRAPGLRWTAAGRPIQLRARGWEHQWR